MINSPIHELKMVFVHVSGGRKRCHLSQNSFSLYVAAEPLFTILREHYLEVALVSHVSGY